jgi:hypothetical protein
VKARTLYYCPLDENQLLFEEIYDENREFDYQSPQELPEVCPKCGRLLFKKNCISVEELHKTDILTAPANTQAQGQG